MCIKSIEKKIVACFILLVALSCEQAHAQEGSGGLRDNLTIGVGARAFGFGGAFVAIADDPTAVFWNAGAMDFMERKSVSAFHSTMLLDTRYNYAGMTYPTLSFGTFGAGWVGLGANGIMERDPESNELGEFAYTNQAFAFAYSKRWGQTLGLGGALKVVNVSMSTDNSLTDTDIALDVGVGYRPDMDNEFLRDISLGVNFQNLFAAKQTLSEYAVDIPTNIRLGIAKRLFFGEGLNGLRVSADMSWTKNVPVSFHGGFEYSYEGQAHVRVGMNGGQPAFGAGAQWKDYMIDYTYGNYFDIEGLFSAAHRFSITFEFGKTRQELIRIAELERQRQLDIEVADVTWFNAEAEYTSLMAEGKQLYYASDYDGAWANFLRAKDAAEVLSSAAQKWEEAYPDNPERFAKREFANDALGEVDEFLKQADQKGQEAQEKRSQEMLAAVLGARDQEEQLRAQETIERHRLKGIAAFKNRVYNRAITEYTAALAEIDRLASTSKAMPSWAVEVRESLLSDIQATEKQLQGNIQDVLKRADRQASQGNYLEAINILNSLEGISDSEKAVVEERRERYTGLLNFRDNYDEGLRRYREKSWALAKAALGRALKSRPNDSNAKAYFEKASVRAEATPQSFTPSVRGMFTRAKKFYSEGNLDECLKLLENCLDEQPTNKTILDYYDLVVERASSNN